MREGAKASAMLSQCLSIHKGAIVLDVAGILAGQRKVYSKRFCIIRRDGVRTARALS
jgi:hypothetical protein